MATSYYELGSYSRRITTTDPVAQLWFDRGLLWAFSFNHEEAERCFLKSKQHDDSCIMAYWGIAYASGPNYNKTWIRFDRTDLLRTFAKARQALSSRLTSVGHNHGCEEALLEALKNRFPEKSQHIPEDLGELDRNYARAMRAVFQRFPADLDIAALFAEALMCIRPRDLWDLTTGLPTSDATIEARQIIESAFRDAKGREHPALCHLYIHLMEMSPNPELAMPAADRLRRLVPEGSHTLHMGTHIDVACGDYRRVVDSNEDAIIADDKYFAREKGSVLYTMYRAYNIYAKMYGALISGRSHDPVKAVERLPSVITTDLLCITSPPMADWTESYLGSIGHVLIRFGRWEEILQLSFPENRTLYCSTMAMIHYSRGIAFAVLGRMEEAETEQVAFHTAHALVPRSRLNSLPAVESEVLKVAANMLEGEIQYRKKRYAMAFTSLRAAVICEDGLPYTDPPAWPLPSRHALGALLLEQGQVEEAELVYREDLGLGGDLPRRKARVNNVWGLHGLYECLMRNGKAQEAKLLRLQRDIAVASADIPIVASCLCRLSAVKSNSDVGCSRSPSISVQNAVDLV